MIQVNGAPLQQFIGRGRPRKATQQPRLPIKYAVLLYIPIGWQGTTGEACRMVIGKEKASPRNVMQAMKKLSEAGIFEMAPVSFYPGRQPGCGSGRTRTWRRVL